MGDGGNRRRARPDRNVGGRRPGWRKPPKNSYGNESIKRVIKLRSLFLTRRSAAFSRLWSAGRGETLAAFIDQRGPNHEDPQSVLGGLSGSRAAGRRPVCHHDQGW